MDKTCSKCGQSLPVSEFYRQTRAADGLNSWCKECYRLWHIARYTPKEQAPTDPICGFCKKMYTPKQRRPSQYCSRECKGLDRHRKRQALINAAKPARTCPTCGTALTPKHRIDAVFCSVACSQQAHNVTRKIRKRIGEAGPRPRKQQLVSLAYIAKRDKYRCGICGGKVDMNRRHPDPLAASIDHIIPVARGGTNDLANLQLSHFRCNWTKRDGGGGQLRIVG